MVSPKSTDRSKESSWRTTGLLIFITLNVLGFWGFVAFFFYSGADRAYPKVGDEAGVLLSAATLVLTVLTVLLAIFAVVGYAEIRNAVQRSVADEVRGVVPGQVEEKTDKIADQVKQDVDKVKGELEKRLDGRLAALAGSMCVMFAEQQVGRSDLVDAAILQCNKALELLPKDDPRRPGVLNNLAFAYALRQERRGVKRSDPHDAREALKLEGELFEVAREKTSYTDTWARLLLAFHDRLEHRETRLKDLRDVLREAERTGAPAEKAYIQRSLQRLAEVAPNLPD